jgi:hypothetical protein
MFEVFQAGQAGSWVRAPPSFGKGAGILESYLCEDVGIARTGVVFQL